MKRFFIPALSILIITPLTCAANPCQHIFDEVQRFEGLTSDDIAPLRSGCEADIQANMLGYWQCMDENMQSSGYHLDNMLSLGDRCKDAKAKPLAELSSD
ncbi:MAG: hypothetical protein H7A10_02465 [Oceanospirillaceae bacterium]|nr:hypothetical protein [Oceanospirillaceae bacterium]